MATQMYLIVDPTSQATPAAVTAWLLDVAEGETLLDTAKEFMTAQNFPFSSQVYVVDAASVTHLAGSLVEVTP